MPDSRDRYGKWLDSHGPFDPDALVRWAETYGDPEGWAKKAQQLHGENERLKATIRRRDKTIERLRAEVAHGRHEIDYLTGKLDDDA